MQPEGTLQHLAAAGRSFLLSRTQCGAALALLSGAALASPAAAAASGAGAGALLLARSFAGKALARAGNGARQVPAPARWKPGAVAEDDYVVGTEVSTGREVGLSRQEAERNLVVLGTAGDEKTAALLGISDAFLAKGGGMAFVDGTGNPDVVERVAHMAAWYGRLADLQVLDLDRPAPRVGTESMNPFARADAGDLHRILSAVMPEGSRMDRTRSFLWPLSQALAWLSAERGVALDAGVVQAYLTVEALGSLATPGANPGMPAGVEAGIRAYLCSLEGYDPERGAYQAATVAQDHASQAGTLGNWLGFVHEVFGDTLGNATPDIDLAEVVANRRILLVRLPSMEKSGEDLRRLGQLVASALVVATKGAGARKGRVPFLCVLDEVSYYVCEGLGAAASRSAATGTAWVVSAAGVPELRRKEWTEGGRLADACETRIFLRTPSGPPAPDGFPPRAAGPER